MARVPSQPRGLIENAAVMCILGDLMIGNWGCGAQGQMSQWAVEKWAGSSEYGLRKTCLCVGSGREDLNLKSPGVGSRVPSLRKVREDWGTHMQVTSAKVRSPGHPSSQGPILGAPAGSRNPSRSQYHGVWRKPKSRSSFFRSLLERIGPCRLKKSTVARES